MSDTGTPSGSPTPSRRVVTGRNGAGRDAVVLDGPVEVLLAHLVPPGIEEIWAWDGPVAVPNDGSAQPEGRYFPPPDAYRVRIITFRPDGQAPLGAEETAEVGRLLAGVHTDAEWDQDRPGMHRTRSIDVGLVLEGSVVLELDGGDATTLHAGDWFVQNGTRHAWSNPTDTPCRVLIFMIGAALEA